MFHQEQIQIRKCSCSRSCIWSCIYVYLYICIAAYLYRCLSVQLYISIYIYLYSCICICICSCTCICNCICICIYIYICICRCLMFLKEKSCRGSQGNAINLRNIPSYYFFVKSSSLRFQIFPMFVEYKLLEHLGSLI